MILRNGTVDLPYAATEMAPNLAASTLTLIHDMIVSNELTVPQMAEAAGCNERLLLASLACHSSLAAGRSSDQAILQAENAYGGENLRADFNPAAAIALGLLITVKAESLVAKAEAELGMAPPPPAAEADLVAEAEAELGMAPPPPAAEADLVAEAEAELGMAPPPPAAEADLVAEGEAELGMALPPRAVGRDPVNTETPKLGMALRRPAVEADLVAEAEAELGMAPPPPAAEADLVAEAEVELGMVPRPLEVWISSVAAVGPCRDHCWY
ncbi:hypothetical protein CNMCM5878_000165 [Aspergillus fumigatiaffinis]|nr:hypothetical protein CNMCM5878_000165 [Aspergillus fumigatiaffinis]